MVPRLAAWAFNPSFTTEGATPSITISISARFRSFSSRAFRTLISASSRLMVRWLLHVPFPRAPKHARGVRPVLMKPPPNTPHFAVRLLGQVLQEHRVHRPRSQDAPEFEAAW
jgi:hypothetical protein